MWGTVAWSAWTSTWDRHIGEFLLLDGLAYAEGRQTAGMDMAGFELDPRAEHSECGTTLVATATTTPEDYTRDGKRRWE